MSNVSGRETSLRRRAAIFLSDVRGNGQEARQEREEAEHMLTAADVALGGGAMHHRTRNSGACRRGSPVLLPVFVAALLVTGTGCQMARSERKIEAKVHP
jgi:hypothetical protein